MFFYNVYIYCIYIYLLFIYFNTIYNIITYYSNVWKHILCCVVASILGRLNLFFVGCVILPSFRSIGQLVFESIPVWPRTDRRVHPATKESIVGQYAYRSGFSTTKIGWVFYSHYISMKCPHCSWLMKPYSYKPSLVSPNSYQNRSTMLSPITNPNDR